MLAYLVKVAIPDYLAGLPIPDTIGGWFRLGCKYLSLITFIFSMGIIYSHFNMNFRLLQNNNFKYTNLGK